MLRRLLKSIGRARKPPDHPPAGSAPADAHPVFERERRSSRAQAGISLELHRRIQFGGVTVGGLDFLRLLEATLRDSMTGVAPAKAFHRYQSSLHLAQYFVHALAAVGERAECGVFTGCSSLLMCRLARARDPVFDGSGFHLVDSFEGISAPGAEDALELRAAGDGSMLSGFAYGKGAMAAPIGYARRAMREFPAARLHQGWIPAVLASLPDVSYAFVHIDVDLYEPTRACLEFFHRRLARGGVILCDDYGAKTFPGAARAWDEYCDSRGIAYALLDTGQSVILRE